MTAWHVWEQEQASSPILASGTRRCTILVRVCVKVQEDCVYVRALYWDPSPIRPPKLVSNPKHPVLTLCIMSN